MANPAAKNKRNLTDFEIEMLITEKIARKYVFFG